MTITDAPTNPTSPWSWATPQNPVNDAQPASTTAAPTKPPAAPAPASLRALAINEIISGILWIVAGIAITVGTLAAHLPVFFVAFGPVIYGGQRVRRGLKLLAKA